MQTTPRPMLSWAEYLKQHREHDKTLKRHMSGKGRKKYKSDIVEEVKRQSAESLFSTNLDARLAFLRCARRAFRQAALQPPDGFFMLTLAPRDFAVPLKAASSFDHQELKRWAERYLFGKHYFGMVDAALYTKTDPSKRFCDPVVSWHVHVMVWGCSKAELEQLCEIINREHFVLIHGFTVAHIRVVSPKGLLGRLCYVLKAPLKGYRVSAFKTKVIDPNTGDFKREIWQNKDPLRPGQALDMARVFSGRVLPSLALANGQGTELLKQTILMATAELREQDRQYEQKLERRARGSSNGHTTVTSLPHPPRKPGMAAWEEIGGY